MWRRRRKRGAPLPRQLALGLLEDAMGRVEQRTEGEPEEAAPLPRGDAARGRAGRAGRPAASRRRPGGLQRRAARGRTDAVPAAAAPRPAHRGEHPPPFVRLKKMTVQPGI